MADRTELAEAGGHFLQEGANGLAFQILALQSVGDAAEMP